MLPRFMALSEPDYESNDEQCKAADTMEKVIAHIIDMKNGRKDAEAIEEQNVFANIGTVKYGRISASYTA